MKFKYILNGALPLLSLLAMTAACDNIAVDDRFISEPKPAPDPYSVPKTLLIQEFTGVRCPNCPTGAQIIHNIIESNPGRVIAVGLHAEGAGSQTRPWTASQDFRTPEAQALYSYYGRPDLPRAVFNGVSSGELPSSWPTIADEYLLQGANMTIELNSAYSESDRTVTVKYDVTFTDDVNDKLNVMVWLTEDGIVGRQSSLTETIRDYTHNHVLRKSFFSEEWGKELGSSFKNGHTLSGEASTALDENWVAENCNVVVFIQRADNKIVEQSAEIPVISEN